MLKGILLWPSGSLAICFAVVASALVVAAPPEDGLALALQAALSRHPMISGKQAEVEAREFAADAARSQRYPTISAQAQQYGSDNESSLTGEDLSTPASLRARQPLWAFGRIDDTIAFSDAETAVERADLLRVCRQVLEETAVAYASVQGSRERLQVAERNVQAHQVLFEQIRRRQEGQLASKADVALALARLAQAQARVHRYAGELDVALSDLRALTQVPLQATRPVPSGLGELPEPPELRRIALERSAEVIHGQSLIERAKAGVDQARTASMPTLYLQAERFYDQPDYLDDERVSLVFEGQLDGLGFASRGRTRAARAQQIAAEQDLAAARTEVERVVQRLQRNRQLQQDLINVQGESLRDLETLLESYRRQYEAGTKSWLDLLNMQRELNEQQLQYVQAQNDWLIYSLQLAALSGGLDVLAGLTELL